MHKILSGLLLTGMFFTFNINADEDKTIFIDSVIKPNLVNKNIIFDIAHVNVLIVEDNAIVAALIREILIEKGLRTSTASNGLEALASIEEEKPSIVICEENLPVLDGNELCTIMRTNPTLHYIPIILLTTKELKNAIKDNKCGADGFIKKPFEPNELLETIRTTLRPDSFAHKKLETPKLEHPEIVFPKLEEIPKQKE